MGVWKAIENQSLLRRYSWQQGKVENEHTKHIIYSNISSWLDALLLGCMDVFVSAPWLMFSQSAPDWDWFTSEPLLVH